MKPISKYKAVREYWNKHSRQLVNKARKASGIDGLTKDTVRYQFVDNVEAYMEEDGMTASEAIAKELRSREFKSQADFYAEGVIENIKENFAADVGFKNGRFRNSKGQFTSDKFKEIAYDGEVNIEGANWKVYRMPDANNQLIYYYETGSPKSGTFQTFMSRERYY